jgi:four helix bundle protein
MRNSLGTARGSLYELQTQVELALDLKFILDVDAKLLLDISNEVGKLINGLLNVLHLE